MNKVITLAGRQNADFKFSSLVADVELPEWASRFGI